MNLTSSKKKVGHNPTPSESLRRELGLYQHKLKVVVQPIANATRDNENGCGLTNHFYGAFKDRIEYLSNADMDILILTEFQRLLTDQQKNDFNQWMDDFGYELTGSYMKNDQDKWAFETMMWNKKSVKEEWNLIKVDTPTFSYHPPDERRTWTLKDGAVIAYFQHIETGKCCNIGAIHNTLICIGMIHNILSMSENHADIIDIILDEYRNMSEKSIQDNVQWFGDFNISYVFRHLAAEREDLLEYIKSVNLVYTELSDFCCGTADYISQVVSEFYGGNNVIGKQRKDGSCRQVAPLCKAAGKNIRLLALLHPVTLENTILMTRSEIAEMSRGLDFNSGCFDHMTCICEVYAE